MSYQLHQRRSCGWADTDREQIFPQNYLKRLPVTSLKVRTKLFNEILCDLDERAESAFSAATI